MKDEGTNSSSPPIGIPSVQACSALGASAIHADALADGLHQRLNARGFQNAGDTLTK